MSSLGYYTFYRGFSGGFWQVANTLNLELWARPLIILAPKLPVPPRTTVLIFKQGCIQSYGDKSVYNIIEGYKHSMISKDFALNKSLEGVSNKAKLGLLQTFWIKSFRTKVPYQDIVPHLSLVEYKDEDIICRPNQKISSYYLLIDGVVNAYENKEGLALGEYLTQIRQPQFVGQSIYSLNTHRTFTWKAVGSVRCCRIDAQKLLQLTSTNISEYNQILSRLCNILGVEYSVLSRYQLYKVMMFRNLARNVKVTQNNEKSGNKSVFFILEGECKLTLKQGSLKQNFPQGQRSGYQHHLLNLCANQILGVEYHFQNQYRYDYVIVSANCQLVELDLKDIRDSYHRFPQQLFDRMKEVYDSHRKIINNKASLPQKSDSEPNKKVILQCYNHTKKIQNILKEVCMYIPPVESSVKREYVPPEPTSAFIPLRIRRKQIQVEMVRRDWKTYVKLPSIHNKANP